MQPRGEVMRAASRQGKGEEGEDGLLKDFDGRKDGAQAEALNKNVSCLVD